MQNDRSSSQFSLHLQYISRKEMITARKEDDSFDTVISCNSFLPRRGIKIWGEEWKKNKRWNAEGRGPIPRPSIEILPSTRVTRPFFYFFQNICFQFQGSSKLDSIFECFSSRYVTGKKRRRERTKERRRKEEGRWKEAREKDEGNSEGRKESHTMARMKRKKEKGWGSERKIDGGGMYQPAHSIFRVFLFCPLRQPDKGPSGEELAARYSPDQLETRCQMENSSE